MEKFECKMFGDCCKDLIQGPGSEYQGSDFIKFAIDPQRMGLPILDWEIESLEERANALGIHANRTPSQVMLGHDGVPIAIEWTLEHRDCPFLASDNKCRVYENRPSVCKTFPIGADNRILLNCRCFSEWEAKNISKHELYAIFGTALLEREVRNAQSDFLTYIHATLIEKGLIVPIGIDREELSKKVQRGYHHLSDFLEKENIMDKRAFYNQLKEIRENVIRAINDAESRIPKE